jgi:hypothetical protein
VIGDKGSDALPKAWTQGQAPRARLQLRFHLAEAAVVWAEAQGLRGLRQGGGGGAPEVFMDEAYLGPLRADHGKRWRSPKALALEAGEHVLLIRTADVADADDVVLQRVLVLSEGVKEKAVKARKAWKSCEGLTLRKSWPASLRGGSKTLSVLTGREARSGELVTLKAGEAWKAQVRIPYAQSGKPLPLAANLFDEDGVLRLTLFFDATSDPNAPVGALGYKPGRWQGLQVRHCGNRIQVAIAQAPPMDLSVDGKPRAFEITARDLELSLKPAR